MMERETGYKEVNIQLGHVTTHHWGSFVVWQVADVELVASRVLQNPVQLGLLCTSLCQCFEFDGAAAGLLLHAPQEAGTHVAQPPRRIEAGSTASATEGDAQLDREQQSERPQAALSAISLPRMPVGLSRMSSQASYDAVAGISRTAGRVASLAGKTPCQAHSACMALSVM